MREIILDTETTGLSPAEGHRLVEIGCLEIVNQIPTGATYHVLINPERDVPDEAYRVHGHSTTFLADKPVFAQVVTEFLAFIGEDRLVIHNAEFDMRFINAELVKTGRDPISNSRVIDTLALARRKHPGAPNSLDALCDRYRIDRSRRIKHGALLDAEILVEVYGELLGGRQRSLVFSGNERANRSGVAPVVERKSRSAPLASLLTNGESVAHADHIARLGEGALWRRYMAAGR
ncbi:DNA polymerase III subunit epsilon [Methylocapsa sp. S129]|uniref:DNA polymerase III subunit epsilon n=1 Tax=Methylocapsa sp. S129 TaxID=1641869 RepID=UPI00131CDE18|nr:DNA polymerase III subunit epsilon [Methylocapsa sp. S129]